MILVSLTNGLPYFFLEVELRRKKYYFGKQIKFLVDTPEQVLTFYFKASHSKIWSALECHNYLKAANLYLDAESVHKKLTKVNDDYSAEILVLNNLHVRVNMKRLLSLFYQDSGLL